MHLTHCGGPFAAIPCLAPGAPGIRHLFGGEKAAATMGSHDEGGVWQGMAPGPVLPSAGLHEVLCQAIARHPYVNAVAYLDGITLVWRDGGVQDAHDDLHPAPQTFGYDINASKCASIQGPGANLGLRRQAEIACYALGGVGLEGDQHNTTMKAGKGKAASPNELLKGPSKNLVRVHKSPGANRVLADPRVGISDEAFRFCLKHRLQIQAFPANRRVCEAQGANAHVHKCHRPSSKAKI
eukprot:gene737-biopygen578